MEWLTGGAVGLILGTGLWLLFSYILQRDAKSKANAILEDAKRDIEGRFKEADLKIKERELESKAKSERESNAHREKQLERCLLYTSPSPRDLSTSRMPSSA